jgi:branched-subunit amino acid transport protein
VTAPLSSVELVLAILSLALATLATRSGILVVGERFRLSHRVEAALRFAPACALTALILPEVLYPSGVLDVSLGNPRWPAALVAVVFLLWRHSILGGIAVGMAFYALMRLV